MKERAIDTLHVASDDGFAAENIATDASFATSDTQQQKIKNLDQQKNLQYYQKHC